MFPVPFAFFVALALAGVWLGARSEQPGRGPKAWLAMGAAILGCALIVPLLQIVCFGLTDYRKPADVAVVLGVPNKNGCLSEDALANLVKTGVGLYKQRMVSKIIFSGWHGCFTLNDADVMRSQAIEAGVNPDDILVDPVGINTDQTVRNVMPMLSKLRSDSGMEARVLVVSHFYHLPRIKIRFGEELRDVLTVPAREPFSRTTKFVLREIADLWKYYANALVK